MDEKIKFPGWGEWLLRIDDCGYQPTELCTLINEKQWLNSYSVVYHDEAEQKQIIFRGAMANVLWHMDKPWKPNGY